VLGRQQAIPSGYWQDLLAEHTKLGIDDDMAGFLEPPVRTRPVLLLPYGRYGKMGGDVDAGAKD
jgi:hypothetical protein